MAGEEVSLAGVNPHFAHGEGVPESAYGMDDEDRRTDEERYLDEMRAASSCLRCFNVTMFVIGAGLCVFSYIGGNFLAALQWLSYAISGVGLLLMAMCVVGLVGFVNRHTHGLLVLYYTMLVFCMLGLMILGGFCFILTESAKEQLAARWDSYVASLPASEQDSANLSESQEELELYMYVAGGVSVVLVLMLGIAMSNVIALVTPVKAYSVLIQATCIAMLPFGVGMIAAAYYLADTAASVEAPFASFSMFLMGFLVIVVTLMGCVGTGLQSRGVVKVFMLSVAVFAVLFMIAGVAALAQAATVESYLYENWDSIRRVLPPTFSGKYDREIFARFVQDNLNAMGYTSICAGMVLGLQAWAGRKLRRALRERDMIEDQVDSLYDKSAKLATEVRDAVEALKHARGDLRMAGVGTGVLRDKEAQFRAQEERRYNGLKAQLDVALGGIGEEEGEDGLGADEEQAARLEEALTAPAQPRREDAVGISPAAVPHMVALRRAVYELIRARGEQADVEVKLDLLEGRERRRQGLAGMKSRRGQGGVEEEDKEEHDDILHEVAADKSIKTNRRTPRQVALARQLWKRYWTKGEPRHRRMIMCCCGVVFCTMFAVIILAGLLLYYSSACDTIGNFSESTSYTSTKGADFEDKDAEPATDDDAATALPNKLFVEHSVSRGIISVSTASSLSSPKIALTKTAFREEFSPEGFPTLQVRDDGFAGIEIENGPEQKIADYDVTCQAAIFDLQFPEPVSNSQESAVDESAPQLDISTTTYRSGIELSFDDSKPGSAAFAKKPRFHYVSLAAKGGSTEVVGALLGGKGLQAVSELGDIVFDKVHGACDPDLLGQDGVGISAETDKGTLLFDDSEVVDCDVTLAANVSLVRVTESAVHATLGAATMTIQGDRGLVEVHDSEADVFDIKSIGGSIRAFSPNASRTFRASTTDGNIDVASLIASRRGVVQVETDQGAITIHGKQFAGILSIVTAGNIKCTGCGFDAKRETAGGTDGGKERCKASSTNPCKYSTTDTGLKIVEDVNINCQFAGPNGRDDCPYLGEMSITSQGGDVTLDFDQWDVNQE